MSKFSKIRYVGLDVHKDTIVKSLSPTKVSDAASGNSGNTL